MLRQIQEFKALDEQHRRKLNRYKIESNQKFEKIKDKVFEIKLKQEEIKATEEPVTEPARVPEPPKEEPKEPATNEMVINTDKIKNLKNKRFKKEIKPANLNLNW